MTRLRFLAPILLGALLTSPTAPSTPAQGQGTPSDAQPRVALAWAAGLMEARLAFDQPANPSLATKLVGTFISFGDQEKPTANGRPGGNQGRLRIAAAQLEDGGRTLVLITDPHPRTTTYRLNLPGNPNPVQYTLGGVEVALTTNGKTSAGWWPTLNPSENSKRTLGSTWHEQQTQLTQKIDNLTLQSLVNAPRGDVKLTLEADYPFELTVGAESTRSEPGTGGLHRASLKTEAIGDPVFLSLTFTDLPNLPRSIRADLNGLAVDPSNWLLPWAQPGPGASPAPPIPASLAQGGDPVRGQTVFYSEQARCANCHQFQGKGGLIGPDLSNLAGVDRAWLYQNIVEPSASIHPEYLSYTVTLKDGRIAMGVVRAEDAKTIKVSSIDTKQTLVLRSDIEEIRPSSSSIMPVGLLGAIGEDNTRDLLAFLTTKPR